MMTLRARFLIFDERREVFHQRFRDHAMRIMERYGFHILATWESKRPGRTEFVYLLQWPDTATMRVRWARRHGFTVGRPGMEMRFHVPVTAAIQTMAVISSGDSAAAGLGRRGR